MTDPIVSRTLILVRPSGEDVTVTMSIGKPYSDAERHRCPVSLEPLHKRLPDIEGVDTWQALQLAMRVVYLLLEGEIEKGGKLYWQNADGTRSEDEDDLREASPNDPFQPRRDLVAFGCSEAEFRALRCPKCGAALTLRVHPERDVFVVECHPSSGPVHFTLHGRARGKRPEWWKAFESETWTD